jgi:hypothetical protein
VLAEGYLDPLTFVQSKSPLSNICVWRRRYHRVFIWTTRKDRIETFLLLERPFLRPRGRDHNSPTRMYIMKSISSLALVAATLLIITSNATDDNLPSQGCFDSTVGLTVENTTDIFTSKGSCSQTCIDLNKPVFGLTNKTWCYCGSDLPPANAQVDNSSCSTSCPGYPANICMNCLDIRIYTVS